MEGMPNLDLTYVNQFDGIYLSVSQMPKSGTVATLVTNGGDNNKVL